VRAGFTAARGGYSLIEVLLALLLLMILVQVIGASLVTVLSVEQQASEARELSDVSQILVTDALLGVSEAETMREWPYPDWKPEYKPVTVGRGENVTQWHEWSLTARYERQPRLQMYVLKRGD